MSDKTEHPAPAEHVDVEAVVKAAIKSVIDEHPMGHWNDEQVRTVARRAVRSALATEGSTDD